LGKNGATMKKNGKYGEVRYGMGRNEKFVSREGEKDGKEWKGII